MPIPKSKLHAGDAAKGILIESWKHELMKYLTEHPDNAYSAEELITALTGVAEPWLSEAFAVSVLLAALPGIDSDAVGGKVYFALR